MCLAAETWFAAAEWLTWLVGPAVAPGNSQAATSYY